MLPPYYTDARGGIPAGVGGAVYRETQQYSKGLVVVQTVVYTTVERAVTDGCPSRSFSDDEMGGAKTGRDVAAGRLRANGTGFALIDTFLSVLHIS